MFYMDCDYHLRARLTMFVIAPAGVGSIRGLSVFRSHVSNSITRVTIAASSGSLRINDVRSLHCSTDVT